MRPNKEKSSQESEVMMTEMVLPQHTNSKNTIFGGVVLSWIDIAAAISAVRHCEMQVVTAGIDAMEFLAPVRLGWIVTIKAKVNFASKTSCEVGVKVTAENPLTREHHHTATAYVTMVALDSNGRPTAIPQIKCENETDTSRFKAAIERRKLRLQMKELRRNEKIKK